MSLTSLLSNPVASEPLPHLVPASPQADGGERGKETENGAKSEIGRDIKRMRTVEKTEADEDSELRRPPYTYVCLRNLSCLL